MTDPTRRFSDRVHDYARYRPGYPSAVVDVLRTETGLDPSWVVADVGSGTGLSSELLLRNGNTVLGVEPNREMRAAAEALLAVWPRFRIIAGSAEATTLDARSVDLVLAGQSFHWFDVDRAREEFGRILRDGRWAALLWNTRKTAATPFLRAYEDLLLRFGTDYAQVRHDRLGDEPLRRFYRGPFRRRVLANEQVFDLAALRGRLLSTSYVPPSGHPEHEAMLLALERIFDRHQKGGTVRFVYDTEIYIGRLH